MFTSADLKAIITEARPIIERQLDDAELIASIRTKVTNDGGDWGQVKALLKAMIQDERDDTGDGKRVAALLGKAEHATAYADMLGIGNLNEKNSFGTVVEFSHNPASNSAATGERHSQKQITATEVAADPEVGARPASSSDLNSPVVTEASRSTRETDVGDDGGAQSTAARTDVRQVIGSEEDGAAFDAGAKTSQAGTQAPPVDTHNPGGENANSVGNAGASHPSTHPEAKATAGNAATVEPLRETGETTAGRESQVGGDEPRASSATSELMDVTAGETATNSETHDGQGGEKPLTAASPTTDGVGKVASPSVVAFTPKPHDGPRDSQGLPRPKGCQNVDMCASSSWRHRCHGCDRAFIAAQGVEIPHQGSVA